MKIKVSIATSPQKHEKKKVTVTGTYLESLSQLTGVHGTRKQLVTYPTIVTQLWDTLIQQWHKRCGINHSLSDYI